MNRYNICIKTQRKVLTCDSTEQLLSLVKWKQESEQFVKSRKFDAYVIESVRLRETSFKSTENRNLQEPTITYSDNKFQCSESKVDYLTLRKLELAKFFKWKATSKPLSISINHSKFFIKISKSQAFIYATLITSEKESDVTNK